MNEGVAAILNEELTGSNYSKFTQRYGFKHSEQYRRAVEKSKIGKDQSNSRSESVRFLALKRSEELKECIELVFNDLQSVSVLKYDRNTRYYLHFRKIGRILSLNFLLYFAALFQLVFSSA